MCKSHGVWWFQTSWVRWNVGFTTMSFHVTRVKCFFHLGYQQDGNGRVGVVMCSKAHSQLKALFANDEGIVFWPSNDNIVLAHDGPT